MQKNDLEHLQTADIGLSFSDSFIGRAIRYFETKRSGSARYSHAWLALGDLTIQPEVIESLSKVTRSPVQKYYGRKIIVYRNNKLTKAQCNEIGMKCAERANHGYAWLKIPLFALDAMFKTYFFTSMFGISSFQVCSNLVAWAYEKVLGYEVFGVGWRSVSPDVIDDYCMANPDIFDVVFNNSERTDL